MATVDQSESTISLQGQEEVGVGEGGQRPLHTPGTALNPGAPPSNTAPANSIGTPSGTHILRSGVDSLYVSYPGSLSAERAGELERLKESAKLPTPEERASAVIKLNDHLFEVKDRGKGRFPYVLADNWYHIQVSGENSAQLPLAYVQLRSELLTLAGWEAGLNDLNLTVDALVGLPGEPSISRVDICTDFTTELDIGSFPIEAWIARPKQKSSYYAADRLTGYAFGMGGDMSARLYDKTEEIRKSRKFYLEPIWRDSGWDGVSTVWRLEFQFKRPVLRELGVESSEDLAFHIADLWRYATSEWLRLAIPNSNDSTRSRWENHSLWDDLTSVEWNWDAHTPLQRTPKTRAPDDHYLFKNGISGITSYMARNGIYDFYDGLSGFIRDAVEYHRIMGREAGEDLQSYARSKVLDKARRYNALINPVPELIDGTEGES